MMLDENVVAVSPSSVYRVLKSSGFLSRWNRRTTSKGDGFKGPLQPQEHWHIDVSYINIMGTFYYLCSILDGYSRYIVHWKIRESMTEADVEIILQRAWEKFPDAHTGDIGQRPSIYRQGLQGVHPDQRHETNRASHSARITRRMFPQEAF